MFRRLVSTTARLHAELPSNVPSTAAGLGFAQRTEKRSRNFDLSLTIPKTSGKIVTPQVKSKSRPQPWKGVSETPRGDQKNRKPRQARQAPAEPTNDEFFAEIDIVKPESVNKAKAKAGRKEAVNVDMAAPRYVQEKRREKPTRKSPKLAAPRRQVARVVDNSPAGLFGRVSLLTPVRRGAADLKSSMGSQGVEDAEARRQEVRRLAGDYSLFAPVTTPASLCNGSSKELALRVLAQNPQLGLRAQQQARGVLDSLMR